jgi:phage baseplate assembly protein W
MAIPQITRVNPLDLQKNIAIGVSLPFGNIYTNKLFNQTFSTSEQIKSNLVNLLLTNRGERIFNPEFGCGLREILFEQVTPLTEDNIRDTIISSINIYVPDITINNIEIINSENTYIVTVKYIINISGNPDQIIVQFQ